MLLKGLSYITRCKDEEKAMYNIIVGSACSVVKDGGLQQEVPRDHLLVKLRVRPAARSR